MLKGKQKKLDKNKDGKISGEDFKMMAPKKAALGAMMLGKAMEKKDKAMPIGFGLALAKKDMLKKLQSKASGGMLKANEGKSVKTSETLKKLAGKKTMKDLGQLKGAVSEKELKFLQDLSSKEAKDAKSKFISKNTQKSLDGINAAVSEKELNFIRGLNKSKGGAIKKAKYGKMMKASQGSMASSEGSTNKVRGTGIAVKGTNFKGIF